MPYPKIKALREQIGRTQSETASLLNMPLITYRSYETGVREPNLDVLVRLSEMYDVSIDYILDHTPTELSFGRDDILRIKKYHALDEHGQKLVSVILNLEFKRCSTKDNDASVRLAAYGGGTSEKPIPDVLTGKQIPDITPEELEALEDEDEADEIKKKMKK